MPKNRMRNKLLLAALFSALSPLAPALPQDAEQNIIIESDREYIDENEALGKIISIHEGSVKITHGSMQLTADKVTAERVGENTIIDCVGKPVAFQIETLEHGLIKGRAGSIHYDVNGGTLAMADDIELIREDGTTKSAEALTFDLNTEEWVAEGTDDQRPRTVIPAPATRKKSRENADGDS